MRTLQIPARLFVQARLIFSMCLCLAIRPLLYPILGVLLCSVILSSTTGCARKGQSDKASASGMERVLDYRNGWYHFASGTENIVRIATRYRRDAEIVAQLNKLTPSTVPDSGVGVYIPPVHEPAELQKVIARVTADPTLIPHTPPDPTMVRPLPSVAPANRKPFKPDLLAESNEASARSATEVAALQSDIGGVRLNRNEPNVMSVSDGRLVSAMTPESASSAVSSKGYRWPVQGRIISRFDSTETSELRGITIEVAKGTPIRAARAGQVEMASAFQGYGQLVIIRHSDGLLSIYGYNDRVLVTQGQSVLAGQMIAISGSPSATSSDQVFFALREKKDMLNPEAFLP